LSDHNYIGEKLTQSKNNEHNNPKCFVLIYFQKIMLLVWNKFYVTKNMTLVIFMLYLPSDGVT